MHFTRAGKGLRVADAFGDENLGESYRNASICCWILDAGADGVQETSTLAVISPSRFDSILPRTALLPYRPRVRKS